MIAKTEAIPVRIASYGGSSHIVTWITPEYGKIGTVIKGAQRPKRVGGGQYDLGYVCELLFYERELNGLHTLKDCLALTARRHMRGQWQKTALLSYFCLLAGSGTFPRVKNPVLYQNLILALQALERTTSLIPLMLWFEFQLLSIHGTTPQLQHCIICRSTPKNPALLSPKAGGMICPACNTYRGFTTYSVNTDTLRFLQVIQRLQKPLPATSMKSHQNISDTGITAIGHFISLWMDISPHARDIAIQMTQLKLPRK